MAAIVMLSADRAKVRFVRALRQVRYLVGSSACPRALRAAINKVVDDALAGDTNRNPEGKAFHR